MQMTSYKVEPAININYREVVWYINCNTTVIPHIPSRPVSVSPKDRRICDVYHGIWLCWFEVRFHHHTRSHIILTRISLKHNYGSNFVLDISQASNVNKHAFGHGKNRMIGRWLWLAGYGC